MTSSFPEDFTWGTATASYQIEGAFDVDGREINTYVDEDKLRDAFTEATESVESDIIMEYADEAMSEVGVI